MAPTPQEYSAHKKTSEARPVAADGNRVVISGMAGLYPQARYVKDLENILYNKLNPVCTEGLRWKYNHPEVPQYAGNVPDLELFDAQFFKVHFHLGNSMDSMSRKILEQTYEAIYDAGISPEHLSGKKVGVYIGTCFSETEKACFYVATNRTGFGIAGCSKAMFANRISYWLNAKGPSVSVDEACCSSTSALEAAYKAITHGECEAAIVGGANLSLHPQSSVHYGRIMKISMDGKTKSFDEDATGCAKSEAINVLFLQKAKDAKRVYADVLHVKCEFVSLAKGDTGPRFGFYRNPADSANFLQTFYKEAGVPPAAVEYVEAFGSAVPEADKSELEALDKVFCDTRKEPLLVGSIMSNIGYAEAASGISAITKVLLGYHKGLLAGNMHCTKPRQDVRALREGRMRVLTDHHPFRRSYAAVNSMSVTGVNAHVLLSGHYKHKDLNRYKTNIPRLVTISGRHEPAVTRALDLLKSHPIDPEELALLYNIHETNIAGHLGKGYTILDTNGDGETISLIQRAEYFDGTQRPLWFVYSGMGSQWAGMGAQLMRIPIFAAAIERCRKVLEPKGIDIVHIITSPDKTIFDNILHSFVGIAAVQIGLTDILLQLGLVPDKIIGHSVGELGCAYADGCLTAEEMILSAYSRGRVSLETPFIRGSMAAVGVGAQKMSTMCPPDIAIACHNSAESCTISGPADAMRAFVTELTARGVFAKEVPCSNIAYHSRYIQEAGPGLLKYLKEIITTPRARSERWVSSSVPRDRWEEPAAKYSSAEYHTNNLLSPVLFEEASTLVPSDAVLVEVAPHALLQAILKRSLPASAANIPLTRRGHSDGVLMLLEAIGKLYLHGYNPKVRVLYPEVEFPVSTGTPFLSHYVEWAHQEKWPLPLYQSASRTRAASCTFVLTIQDDAFKYLEGHVIKNKTLVPFSFALMAAWDTFAMSLDVPKKSLSVQFSDVKLYTQPILHEQKTVRLSVSLHRGTGRFEVMEENSKVATGFIAHTKTPELKTVSEINSSKKVELCAKDVYQILYERGYDYSGAFRNIYSTDESVSNANVLWNDNWVTFIDGLFQLNTLKYTHSGVVQPCNIGNIVIDVTKHPSTTATDTKSDVSTPVNAQLSYVQKITRCGGVTIENIRFRDTLQINSDKVTLHTLKFVPRFCSKMDVTTSLYVFLQIAAENLNKDSINVLGLSFAQSQSKLLEDIEKIVEAGIPGINLQYYQTNALSENKQAYQNIYDVIVVQNLSKIEKISERFHRLLKPNTFIVNQEDITTKTAANIISSSYGIVSILTNTKTRLELAFWRPVAASKMTSTITVHSEFELSLLDHARNNMSPESNLLILTSNPPVAGLISRIKQWRQDTSRNNVHVIMANDNSKHRLLFDDMPDVSLVYNALDNGVLGGEYYLPLEETSAFKESISLRCGVTGDLNTFKWVPMPEITGVGTLVKVCYAGINMVDVRRALGLTLHNNNNKRHGYGMDFSGITERGERIMGVAVNGSANSYVMVQPELSWPVPAYWSLEDAATVPLAYMLAYYCLVLKTTQRIFTNDVKQCTVLVHGGAGALGQAAISIALARGWRVFTTVSDLDKKHFLMRLYPQLNERDIGNSRDSSFGDMVLSATNGVGCNAVLCCVKGDLKNVSLNCCGPSSSVLDTQQIMSNDNFTFGMYNLTNERSYIAVDIRSVFSNPNSDEILTLHSLVSDGIARGEVRPLTRITFGAHEAARAFRLLAASGHRGRALLRLGDESAPSLPRVSTEADPCHIVICGSSPLGLQVTDSLIEVGVKKIHLHVNASHSALLRYKQCVWKELKSEIVVTYGNFEKTEDISDLLHSATKLGSVESLHVVADSALQESDLYKIDLTTRTICPTLKRFVVLTTDSRIGQNTCVQRAKIGLPATLLDLSSLDSEAEGGAWYRKLSNAVQQAWQSADTVLLALPTPTPRRSLLQEIAALTDTNICDKTQNSTSLAQLGMSLEKSSSVCSFLRDVHHISLNEEDIPQLTIQRINQIESMTTPAQLEERRGLRTFFSYVDPDELLATTEMVFLPTLTSNYSMRDDEFDSSQTYLCIVPGLEGLHARFRTLCEHLKLPAFVLQPGLDCPTDTPAQLAGRYAEVLLKKTVGVEKTFYILGYETGVLVSLELAAILEDHGLVGTVFCLGDGPLEMQGLLRAHLSELVSEEALQCEVARHMFALMCGGSSAAPPLDSVASWGARLDVCVRALLGRVSHSAQYARALLEAAYARIGAALRAEPEPRALRSRIVLLRARDTAGDACSLQSWSNDPLALEQLATPMAHATNDLRVPAIINSYLDQQILDAFEKKNLCDTYLMNADAFMTSSNK